jgi:hypothetical protein
VIIEIPDHYAQQAGGALVFRAVREISDAGYVPAYIYQFADLWEKGMRYNQEPFWVAVFDAGAPISILKDAGVI